MLYRLVPLASRSRDHTTSGRFWPFRVIKTVGNGTAVMCPVVGPGHWMTLVFNEIGTIARRRSIQQNKRLRFIGLCPRYIPGVGRQYESENISGYVTRRITKVSGIVAADEPGPWPEAFRYLTKGN